MTAAHLPVVSASCLVVPAPAGTQPATTALDSRLRGNDGGVANVGAML